MVEYEVLEAGLLEPQQEPHALLENLNLKICGLSH